ncbi:MAG TPA: flagellar biosynthesis anti-sigma factor FlgM [Bryobacteraceae bacterium]|jgi:anti-sigma28 factor (negative regulator of flagellin synthesis)|nr:flagellar biosynthesis anti-sigma factor FlgM [Bryobacteraceae bacterium]
MRLQLDADVTANGVTKPGAAGQTVPVGTTGADSRRVAGDSSGADSIRLSATSNALHTLSADRAARVQQLTAQVQNGSYQVSGSLVGRAIVDDAVSGGNSQVK